MTIAEIRSMMQQGLQDGSLTQARGNLTSGVAGTPDNVALATLSTLFMNLGTSGFNAYCENLRSLLGWWNSKKHQMAQYARELRTKYQRNDPTTRQIFQGIISEFINPLIQEHIKKGGTDITADQAEVLCATLLAELFGEIGCGNEALARRIEVIGSALDKSHATNPLNILDKDGYCKPYKELTPEEKKVVDAENNRRSRGIDMIELKLKNRRENNALTMPEM